VTYALATALGRPLAEVSSPLALTAVTTSAGALGMVPIGLLAGGSATTVDLGTLGLLTYLGVMTLAVAYALLYAGLRTVEGSAALVATLLEPLTAAALAAIVLGERLGPRGLLGALLILGAVAGLDAGDDGKGPVPEGPAPL
jgi:DME family drug/metabolite transporter